MLWLGSEAVTFESRALSKMDELLVAELNAAHTTLGSGMLINRHDAAATGMTYAHAVGRLAGLEIARKLIQQVEDELSGRGKERKKEPT